MAGHGGGRDEFLNVSVTMGAPSFVPGSRVTAVITLRSERAAAPRPPAPPPTAPATGALSLLARAGLAPHPAPRELPAPAFARPAADDYTLLDYVVCEVAGRWTTDRAWVAPHAHAPSAAMLDLHLDPPVAAPASPRPPSPRVRASAPAADAPPAGAHRAHPWAAALDDANRVGGGGRAGHAGVIFRSRALVVCEREQVPVGSRTSFAVECMLPDGVPPTLRGTAVRYAYALVVVVALPGMAAPRAVRVPFRVVSAGGFATDAGGAPHAPPLPVPTPAAAGPVPNRFLERECSRALAMSATLLKSAPPDDIEIALALSLNGRLTPYGTDDGLWRGHNALEDEGLSFVRDSPPSISRAAEDLAGVVDAVEEDELSSPLAKPARKKAAKRNAVPVYAITRGKDSIARMYLPKRKLLLGDTISAVFYFHKDMPCLRLGARLEVHEVVKPQYGLGTKQESSEKGTVFRKVYGEHGEFVMMNRNTHVTFSIPYDAPASFSTDVVEIRWLIHFVFLIPQAETKLTASRLAQSEVLDDEEASRLLDELEIQQENASSGAEVPGWEGGTWAGEDPSTWKQIPRPDVDVLRWTLPLHVTGEPDSQWGMRNSSSLRLQANAQFF